MRGLRNIVLAIVLSVSPTLAAPLTLVAFGDSLTQGYGLPPEEGFVPQLQAWLTAEGEEVVVVNAGVSGDTTAGGAARIGWTLTDEVDALIVALGGNDMLRGLPPEEVRANLTAILTEAQGRGLPVMLVGMTAPGNYGPDYKEAFDRIYPELAEEFDTLLVGDFLGALSAQPDREAALRDLMQGDWTHPNGKGVALIVDEIGPAVRALLARVRP